MVKATFRTAHYIQNYKREHCYDHEQLPVHANFTNQVIAVPVVTIMQDYDPADKIKTLKRLSFAVNKVKYRRDINV